MNREFLAALVAIAASIPLTGCGNLVNVDVNGLVGLSHDGSGGIIVHVIVCNNQSDRVTITEFGATDPTVVYTAREPQEGYFSFALNDSAQWVPEGHFSPSEKPTQMFRVEAEPTNPGGPEPMVASQIITPVSSNYSALISRNIDDVIVNESVENAKHQAVTLEEFKALHTRYNCS